jgi:hypothetical protein
VGKQAAEYASICLRPGSFPDPAPAPAGAGAPPSCLIAPPSIAATYRPGRTRTTRRPGLRQSSRIAWESQGAQKEAGFPSWHDWPSGQAGSQGLAQKRWAEKFAQKPGAGHVAAPSHACVQNPAVQGPGVQSTVMHVPLEQSAPDAHVP